MCVVVIVSFPPPLLLVAHNYSLLQSAKATAEQCKATTNVGGRCAKTTTNANGHCCIEAHQAQYVPTSSAVKQFVTVPVSVTPGSAQTPTKSSNVNDVRHNVSPLSFAKADLIKPVALESKFDTVGTDAQQCFGVKRDGTRCCNNTLSYGGLCHHHLLLPSLDLLRSPETADDTDVQLCLGVKRDGTRCCNNTLSSGGFCHHHDDQRLTFSSVLPSSSARVPLGLCIAAPGRTLSRCESDCKLVSDMLSSKGVRFPFPVFVCSSTDRTKKADVLSQLADLFVRDSDLYILYYSGHGSKGEKDESRGGLTGGGALCTGRQELTFEDIINAWVMSKKDVGGAAGRGGGRPPRRGRRLLLIADSCYSGKLVSKLKGLPKDEQTDLNVGIQAAGNARQCVSEDSSFFTHGEVAYQAGRFTAYWTAKQSEQVRWTEKGQHPQFFATWASDSSEKSTFEVPLGPRNKLVMYSQPDHR